MKFNCSQKDFLNGLQIVNRAIGLNNTLQILNNILIEIKDKKLYLTATNLEIVISFWCDVDIKNEGSITIPAKIISNYINLLPDEKLEISTEEGFIFNLKSKTIKTKIKGLNPQDFPLLPNIEKEDSFQINSQDLLQNLNQTIFAVMVNNTRPALTGIYFNLKDGVLKIVATDGYRLAEKITKIPNKNSQIIDFILPYKTALDLQNILSKYKKEEVEIIISKNQISFNIKNIKLTSKLIKGVFPDYQQIIPKEINTKVILNTQEFTMSIKRIDIFARENNNSVSIKIVKGGKVFVSTETTQIGEGHEEIEAQIEGENNQINLNSTYLLNVLENINSDEIVLEINSKLKPALIKPYKKDDYTYLLMPLKI